VPEKRYYATGKRKTAVARVWIKPGEGSFLINGRAIDNYFPVEDLRIMVNKPFVLNLRAALKKQGLITRDPRAKERKKYGKKAARASFQFSKR